MSVRSGEAAVGVLARGSRSSRKAGRGARRRDAVAVVASRGARTSRPTYASCRSPRSLTPEAEIPPDREKYSRAEGGCRREPQAPSEQRRDIDEQGRIAERRARAGSAICNASQMPFTPELFSASSLQRVEEKRRRKLVAVPYFDGLMSRELDALVDSFAVTPELHDPVRGRVRGTRAFEAFASEASSWLRQHDASVEEVEHVITERHGFEEVILHFDGPNGRVIFRSQSWPTSAPTAGSKRCGSTSATCRARAATPTDHLSCSPIPSCACQTSWATISMRSRPARSKRSWRPSNQTATRESRRETRTCTGVATASVSFYELLFSNGGGIQLEHCRMIDDQRACGLEYNVVRWGETELTPEAGFAVYVRGPNGGLAAARIYDDADPPLRSACVAGRAPVNEWRRVPASRAAAARRVAWAVVWLRSSA